MQEHLQSIVDKALAEFNEELQDLAASVVEKAEGAGGSAETRRAASGAARKLKTRIPACTSAARHASKHSALMKQHSADVQKVLKSGEALDKAGDKLARDLQAATDEVVETLESMA